MQTWTLADIRAKVRKLTGRRTEGNLTTTDLDRFINEYYQNTLLLEIPWLKDVEAWVSLSTVSGTEYVDIDPDKGLVLGPVTIDLTEANVVTWDADYFYSLWPQDATIAEDQPSDLLVMGNQFILRPVPDAVYTIKYRTFALPATALTNGTDEVMNHLLGRLTSYGSSIDVFLDHGQVQEAQNLSGVYDHLLTMAKRPKLAQLISQAPVPVW